MTQPLTPEVALARLTQFGDRTSTWSTATYNDGTEKGLHEIALALAAEVDRLRTELAGREDHVRFLRKTAIPELRRKWESEEDGKKRWQARAEKAEAGLAKVAEFVAARAEYITSLNACHPDNLHDYYRWQGHAESRRQLAQTLGLPVAWPAETEATS